MRMVALVCALLGVSSLAACGSSTGENQSAERERPLQARPGNPDLLSTDGMLFPVSTYFGVCIRYKGLWRAELRNGMLSPHYPTDGEITVPGDIKLTVSVGKFDLWPGTVLEDVPVTSPPRRIRIATLEGVKTVIVSDFDGSGNNLVSIGYDQRDAAAKAEALRLANNVVACHISAVPAKPKGK